MNNNEENNNLFNRENPFRIPDNYFDTLPDKIFSKIFQPESKPLKPKVYINWTKQIAVAAAVAGIIFMSYSGYRLLNNSDNNKQQVAQIIDTTDAVYSFVDENNIVEAMTTVKTTSEKVEGDDIINYLVEDDVDENLIADAY